MPAAVTSTPSNVCGLEMQWMRSRYALLIRQFGTYQVHRNTRTLDRSMSTRSYGDAVEHLNSLQSNAAALEAVRASGGRSSEFAIPEMLEYLDRIGYTPKELDVLNVIHITGTKGKGSTSAFTDSIIRKTVPEWKVGLYTSPHLVAVRERIRINGAPISESDFTKYFFEVWDRLVNSEKKVVTTPPMPGYFRFMTLMAFHVFLECKVDATILEVGVGGTYDSTNIVPNPVVTGVTALGIDHINVLGRTIKEIAWHKSGIFKENIPALTVNQPPEAMEVLESRALELKAKSLTVVSPMPDLSGLKLGLAGVHQVQNAALAVELAKSFIESRTGNSYQGSALTDTFKSGLTETKWPGRCQTVVDPKRPGLTWYLDGAHTVESLDCCIQWFVTPGVGISSHQDVEQNTPISKRALIFNCTSGRSGETFLGAMRDTMNSQLRLHDRESNLMLFDDVIFCTNVTYADGHFKGDLTTKAISTSDLAELKTQQALATAWLSLFPSFPSSHVHVLPSIEDAIKEIDKLQSNSEQPVQVLVTGSLHLIGGVVEVTGLSDTIL
ncbi:Mur ligase [Crassisporium funariophilum]|nr:Mur ligase [Crassisporium funariophilum]